MTLVNCSNLIFSLTTTVLASLSLLIGMDTVWPDTVQCWLSQNFWNASPSSARYDCSSDVLMDWYDMDTTLAITCRIASSNPFTDWTTSFELSSVFQNCAYRDCSNNCCNVTSCCTLSEAFMFPNQVIPPRGGCS